MAAPVSTSARSRQPGRVRGCGGGLRGGLAVSRATVGCGASADYEQRAVIEARTQAGAVGDGGDRDAVEVVEQQALGAAPDLDLRAHRREAAGVAAVAHAVDQAQIALERFVDAANARWRWPARAGGSRRARRPPTRACRRPPGRAGSWTGSSAGCPGGSRSRRGRRRDPAPGRPDRRARARRSRPAGRRASASCARRSGAPARPRRCHAPARAPPAAPTRRDPLPSAVSGDLALSRSTAFPCVRASAARSPRAGDARRHACFLILRLHQSQRGLDVRGRRPSAALRVAGTRLLSTRDLLGWVAAVQGGGAMDLDFILRANPDYVEDLYRQYLRDPQSVGADWAHFFAGFEYGADGRPAAAVQAERQPRRARPHPLLSRARPPDRQSRTRSAATRPSIRCWRCPSSASRRPTSTSSSSVRPSAATPRRRCAS